MVSAIQKPVNQMKPEKKGKQLKDFRQQVANANKHTARGMGLLEDSMNQVGFTAPMIACADGEVIAGSARHETAAHVFGPESEPIVIESDGTRPVVVVRTDIANAQTKLAKKISLLDNRVAQVDLDWDAEMLKNLLTEFDQQEVGKMGFDESFLAVLDPQIPVGNTEIDENALADTNTECPKCGFKWQQA